MTSLISARFLTAHATGSLVVAAAVLATPASASDAALGHLLFDTVPVSFAQLAPTGGALRARVEAVPGVALGEPGVGLGEAEAAPAGVPPQTMRAWGSGFGFSSRVGADRNGAGYKASGGGVTVGFDRFINPTLLGGVALSYTRGETSALGANSDTDTFSGALYGAWLPSPGWEVEALVGIDHSEIDTRRTLTFGTTPVVTRGDTQSLGFNAVGNVGYRFRFPSAAGQTFFKPFVGLSYASQDRDGYTEFGAFGPGFMFPSKTFERSTFNLGAATGIDLATGNGWVVRPELRVAWSRFLSDPSQDVPAFLGGTPFVLRDPDPGRDGAVVGLEVTGITAGLQVFAGYAGEFRDNSTAHQGRAGLRLTW
jgi:outer membrane autotransporter protein